jgi:hypothetical protein
MQLTDVMHPAQVSARTHVPGLAPITALDIVAVVVEEVVAVAVQMLVVAPVLLLVVIPAPLGVLVAVAPLARQVVLRPAILNVLSPVVQHVVLTVFGPATQHVQAHAILHVVTLVVIPAIGDVKLIAIRLAEEHRAALNVLTIAQECAGSTQVVVLVWTVVLMVVLEFVNGSVLEIV